MAIAAVWGHRGGQAWNMLPLATKTLFRDAARAADASFNDATGTVVEIPHQGKVR